MAQSTDKGRYGWRVLLFAAVGLVAGAALAWAVAVLLFPKSEVLESEPYTTIQAVEGEVGSSLALNARAEWATAPVGANMAAGIVTSVGVLGPTDVAPGSVLYTVNLRPVVAAQGSVPAFRTVELGTKGADVVQLQSLLQSTGFYGGAVDGDVGARTVAAIKDWQESLGVDPTGRVEPGDVVYVPSLPQKLTLDADVIARGLAVSGGEVAVKQLSTEPRFVLPLTEGQAAMIPSGTLVDLSANGQLWRTAAGSQEKDPTNGTILIPLDPVNGESICGSDCSSISTTGQTLIPAQAITAVPVSGVTIPSAAILTHADGKTFVVDREGTNVPVTVSASARGMSVVDGLEAGIAVRVPAAE